MPTIGEGLATPSDLARINRLNAWKIMPILLLGYILNTIDKTNIGFASLAMNQALGFTPAVFGLGAGLFFLTYALLEVPSNLLMRRFGARKWLFRILVSWGLVAAAMAFIHSETSFYILRILLGAAEAGWFPGVIYYLSLWFPGNFRARAIMLFYLGAPLAAVLGSPLSGALLQLPPMGGLANWQWLFIFEGLPTVVLGFVLLVVVKDEPVDATWLTQADKVTLMTTLEAERKAGRTDHAIGSWRALLHPTLLLFCLINFLQAIGLYGVFIWIPRIIKEFGDLTYFQIGLLGALPFLFASIAMAVSAYTSDRLRERKWHAAAMYVAGGAALAMVGSSASPVAAMGFLILAMAGVFGVQGVLFAMITEALGSIRQHIALAASLALVTSCGNVGGFVGPYGIGLFVSAFGNFIYALLAIAAVFVAAGVLIALCRKNMLGGAPVLTGSFAPVR